MSRRTALIVGGTGMLGHKMAHVLAGADDLDVHVCGRALPPEAFRASRATYHSGIELGVAERGLAGLLATLGPDVVINAAGAIKHRELAADATGTLYINGLLPHALAALNPNRSGRVIHFSTDCVFTGAKGQYRESDQPDSTDLYGLSKAAGELRYAPHLTIRTSIIGFEIANHLGLVAWFLRQPDGARVRGYRRAIFSGLPTVTLSRTVLDVIRHHPELSGLYHIASEPIAKYDLLGRVAAALGLDRTMIPSDDVAIDRSLDDSRFRHETNTVAPAWDALIAELAADYRSLPYDTMNLQNAE